MMRQLILAAAWLGATGCGPDEAALKRTQAFVGFWNGQYEGRDGAVRYLVERREDGTYEASFIVIANGKVEERISESGSWFIQDDSYKLKIDRRNGAKTRILVMSNYETFSVRGVGADGIQLTHSLSGTPVDERRVSPAFRLEAR